MIIEKMGLDTLPIRKGMVTFLNIVKIQLIILLIGIVFVSCTSSLDIRVAKHEEIHSIEIIPVNPDGSVSVSDTILSFSFSVSPASFVNEISKNDIKLILTTENTSTATYSTLDVDIICTDEIKGVVVIQADISSVLPLPNEKSLVIAISLKYAEKEYTSAFVKIAADKAPSNYSGLEEEWLYSLCSSKYMGRKTGTRGNYLAYSYLKEQVRRLGFEPQSQLSRHFSGDSLRNIVVNIPGQVDSIIIIGAHYDGQYEGKLFAAANDNASGVVSVLSYLNNMKRQNKYSIIVCFWDGEEAIISPAFKGSTLFVDNCFDPNRILYYINSDLVGVNHDNNYLAIYYSHDFLIDIINNSSAFEDYFSYDLIKMTLSAHSSDNQSFFRNNIPCISLTDRSYAMINYPIHSVFDIPENISVERIKKISGIISNLVID